MRKTAGYVSTGTLIILAFSLSSCSRFKRREAASLEKDGIPKVIAAMTLEEKAYFVTGTGMKLPGGEEPADAGASPGAPAAGETRRLVPGAAGTTYEIPRLGIPPMVMADGPAGLRISPTRENDGATYYCTAFPVATLLASTWDTDLVYAVGEAMGEEVLEYGADVLLGPAMNIHRNPLCGRNFEYYSEDPWISGKIAASMIRGVQSRGVGTSVKHFAANNTETNRNALDTLVSERALREIYLEGFRIAVEEAQPWTVMSSYNLINGVYASESHDLLTKVLRSDWGFRGFVMTDWFAGVDAVAQVRAGNDLLMPGTRDQAESILRAVREGRLDEKVLDRNIERILNVASRTPRAKGYKFSNRPDLRAHAAISRRAAAEGMVLLKNKNAALPLSSAAQDLALFGNSSYEIITGGTGSGDVNEAYSVSLADGIEEAGFRVYKELRNAYAAYIRSAREKRPEAKPFMPPEPIAEMPADSALISRTASAVDAALVTIGRNSGEFFDRKVEGDFNLAAAEKDLIRNVSRAFHAKGKRVVVILNIGGVIETASWRDLPDAILLAWQPGQEAGNAIADVIRGRINPSGKLASTFPVRYEDVPSSGNFPGVVVETGQAQAEADDKDGLSAFRKPRKSRIVYEEGIYVGYRYYETFGVLPAYEFGFGLSYTDFEYSGLTLSSGKLEDRLTAAVEVRNAGKTAGREVVQLYISAPAGRLDKPALELKGFVKTRLLQPGESQTVHFELSPREISSFDPASSSWIAEAGKYVVRIGASSRDIRQTAVFELDRERTVKRESIALVPRVSIQEFKPQRRK